ncbi:hypothetical protein ACFWBV_24545 [Streptomyces sp. NPDC060030]|uniref:hypothetical protein n=1 Tax=Streptomyces sp. NPDC060030 TaxID=3347042 RepID=UPI00368A8BC3
MTFPLGRTYLLHGSSSRPTATGAVTFVQGSGGMPGAAEAGDRLGSAVTLTGGVGTSYGPSALATAAGQGMGAVLIG